MERRVGGRNGGMERRRSCRKRGASELQRPAEATNRPEAAAAWLGGFSGARPFQIRPPAGRARRRVELGASGDAGDEAGIGANDRLGG